MSYKMKNKAKYHTAGTQQYRAKCTSKIQEENFGDTKGVIRIRQFKKDRQHNGLNKKDKQRSTKTTQIIKDRPTRTPLETGGELRKGKQNCHANNERFVSEPNTISLDIKVSLCH